MKNILTSIGNKKVAGVILAGATLLVGLGVVNNFSGGSQRAANEAALSRFADNAYNKFGSSSSRADLERQMSAGQDMNTARFMRGNSAEGISEDDAYSSDGAYAEGVRGDEGFVYGAYEGGGAGANGQIGDYAANGTGDAYQPFDATYEQSFNGSDASSNDVKNTAFGEKQFNAVQAEAAAAVGKDVIGKDVKGNNGARGGAKSSVRPSTQINKLTSSNGSGSSSGNGGGGSRGGGASGSSGIGSGAMGADNSTRALPKTKTNEVGNSKSFKFGRGGNIGGFNVSFNGSETKGNDTKGRGAINDLASALSYSGKALASRQDVGQKSLAEASFDGSNPENISAIVEDGASIGTVTSSLLDSNNFGNLSDQLKQSIEDLDNILDETKKQQEELMELQNKIKNRQWILIIGTLVMAVALYFIVKAAYSATAAWALWLVAGLLSVAALAFVWCMLYAGDNSIVGLINQMGDKEKFGLVNEGIDIAGKKKTAAWVGVGLTALLGLCWIPWSNIFGGAGAGASAGTGTSVSTGASAGTGSAAVGTGSMSSGGTGLSSTLGNSLLKNPLEWLGKIIPWW